MQSCLTLNILFIRILLFLFFLLISTVIQAASFVIVDGQTGTTQHHLSNGNTGVIDAGGSLITATAIAIRTIGTIRIENNGLLSTTGFNNSAVYGGFADDSVIMNTGTLTTLGDNAEGVALSGNHVSITNSGTISIAGENAKGIGVLGNDAESVNRGLITTQSDQSEGIFVFGDSARISNAGTIQTQGGDDAYGINVIGNNFEITNSGSISTEGDGAYGIRAEGAIGETATIRNSGSIHVSGANAYAIRGGDNDVTVDLLPGTSIIGAINLGSSTDNDTVNIYTDISASIAFINVENIRDHARTHMNTAVTIELLSNDVRIETDSASLDSVTQGNAGSVIMNQTNIIYTPNTHFIGNDSFSYTLKDVQGNTSSVEVSVAVIGAGNVFTVPGDFPTIQSALDAAVDGDTVQVAAGRYHEQLNFNNKDITLKSISGRHMTFIDGKSMTATEQTVDHVDGNFRGSLIRIGPFGTVSGFMIRNGRYNYQDATDTFNGAAIYVQGTGTVISNNMFLDNQGPIAGIYGNNASPLIEKNYFWNNDCDFFKYTTGGVIKMRNVSSPMIRNNIFVDNYCAAVNLPKLLLGSEPEVINNTFVGNCVAVITYSTAEASQRYRNNLLYGNWIGLKRYRGEMPVWQHNLVYDSVIVDYDRISSQTGLNGNLSQDPALQYFSSGDFFLLSADSPAVDAGMNESAPRDDFRGDPRPVDGDNDGIVFIDIGAYEYIPHHSIPESMSESMPESMLEPYRANQSTSTEAAHPCQQVAIDND